MSSACCATKMSPEKASACCGTATGAACCGSNACSSPCSTSAGGCCDLAKMHLKVVYFAGTGRAEIIRWMLAYAKAPFEDVRLKQNEWPSVKKNYPTEQLPILEYTDPKTNKVTHMVQSATIIRAVAGFTGLAGRTAHDAIEADQAFECIRDVMEACYHALMEKDSERKETLQKKLKDDVMPRMLCHLESKVKENGGKYLTGSSLTYGDFAIATFVDFKKTNCTSDEFTTFEKTYPCLANLAKTIENNHEVKAYLAKRPAPEKH